MVVVLQRRRQRPDQPQALIAEEHDLGHRAEAELARRRAGEQAAHHRGAVGQRAPPWRDDVGDAELLQHVLDVEAGRRAVEDDRVGARPAPPSGVSALETSGASTPRPHGDADADAADRRARPDAAAPVRGELVDDALRDDDDVGRRRTARAAPRAAPARRRSRCGSCGRSPFSNAASAGADARLDGAGRQHAQLERPQRQRRGDEQRAARRRRGPRANDLASANASASSDAPGARAARPRLGPLADGHAVHHGVAHGAVAPQRVVAQHAVLLRAEPLDRALAGEVEVVGAPADELRAERLERMAS